MTYRVLPSLVASTASTASGEPSPRPVSPSLPHHKLLAYGACQDLLRAVLACASRDPDLRHQALRAAKSACLNTAEGASRVSPADKARVFGIAAARPARPRPPSRSPPSAGLRRPPRPRRCCAARTARCGSSPGSAGGDEGRAERTR